MSSIPMGTSGTPYDPMEQLDVNIKRLEKFQLEKSQHPEQSETISPDEKELIFDTAEIIKKIQISSFILLSPAIKRKMNDLSMILQGIEFSFKGIPLKQVELKQTELSRIRDEILSLKSSMPSTQESLSPSRVSHITEPSTSTGITIERMPTSHEPKSTSSEPKPTPPKPKLTSPVQNPNPSSVLSGPKSESDDKTTEEDELKRRSEKVSSRTEDSILSSPFLKRPQPQAASSSSSLNPNQEPKNKEEDEYTPFISASSLTNAPSATSSSSSSSLSGKVPRESSSSVTQREAASAGSGALTEVSGTQRELQLNYLTLVTYCVQLQKFRGELNRFLDSNITIPRELKDRFLRIGSSLLLTSALANEIKQELEGTKLSQNFSRLVTNIIIEIENFATEMKSFIEKYPTIDINTVQDLTDKTNVNSRQFEREVYSANIGETWIGIARIIASIDAVIETVKARMGTLRGTFVPLRLQFNHLLDTVGGQLKILEVLGRGPLEGGEVVDVERSLRSYVDFLVLNNRFLLSQLKDNVDSSGTISNVIDKVSDLRIFILSLIVKIIQSPHGNEPEIIKIYHKLLAVLKDCNIGEEIPGEVLDDLFSSSLDPEDILLALDNVIFNMPSIVANIRAKADYKILIARSLDRVVSGLKEVLNDLIRAKEFIKFTE